MTQTLFSSKYSKLNIFQGVLFGMQNQRQVHLRGRVFLHARKVITMGGKWRISDGSSIRIYKDAWLRCLTAGRILYAPSFYHKMQQRMHSSILIPGGGMLTLFMEFFYLLKLS